MIYTASTSADVARNWAAVYWRGEYRTQAQAREEYRVYKVGGGKWTFWQYLEHMNYRILD